MTIVDDQGRPEPPLAADETATLLGFLDYQRATLAWKCAGLDAAGLRHHARLVDDARRAAQAHGLRRGRLVLPVAARPGPAAPWDAVDWKADPDWEWHSAAEDTPDQLRTCGRTPWTGPAASVAEALADGGLDRLARRPWPDGGAEPALDPGAT